MRFHRCLFVLLALLVIGLHAAEVALNEFPSCAITCNDQLFSDCSLNRTSCFCASDSRPTSLLSCVSSNCTVKEYFTTYRLYENECNITPRQAPSMINPSTLIPFILATFFFITRIIAKSSGLAGGWGWDDYTIIVAFILGVAIYAINCTMIRYGFGRNIWDVPFSDITKFYQLFQGLAVMYKIQISLCKISVCLFLLRIFQTRSFRYIAYALIGVNAAIGISWAFVDSFRCLPTRLTWTGWMGEESGQCINFVISILINCLVNIFVDSVLILMPVWEVIKLQLPLKKKLAVGLMFTVGSVLTIIAIIRVVVFWENRWGINQTVGLFPLIHWSVIEVQISIMCACLPAFRALVGRWFPGLIGSARRTYASHTMEGYNRHTGGNSNINKSVSYSVNYTSRSETNSAVELVDVDAKQHA
ncbi:Putative Integral membrane protein [Penicillium brasilianum]|uniref:Putative Integral membrane protein n=1 Tax=Penicillium brasilianum TaxID=104259 RepID=A0A0F7TBI6_PENBI|nr:Putative Integral membrane protein [Penicillium brasilianum]